MLTEQNKATWCITANTGLAIHPNGSATLCCKFDDGSGWANTLNVKNNTIDECSSNTRFVQARTALNTGQRHPGCKLCFDDEDSGVKSKRQSDNERLTTHIDSISTDLGVLELYLGNTCNLKCRTCGPYSSSQWVDEFYTVYKDTLPYAFDNEVKKFGIWINESRSWHNNSSRFWPDLYQHLDTIRVISVYGGEPWLSKEMWAMLETCIEKGVAGNIVLHFNTNGTQYPEEKIKLFEHFKQVDIQYSIDGIGSQFNYMRHPADWDQVYDNYLRLFNLKLKNVSLSWGITVSILNFLNINDIINKANETSILCYFVQVTRPEWYNIEIVPDNVRSAFIRSINGNKDLAFFADRLGASAHNPTLWNKFVKYTKQHDIIRGESFEKTFPELAKWI